MTPKDAAELVAGALQQRQRQSPALIAIDGASASGTSTLADELGLRLSATVIRGDDFYRDMPEKERWALDAEQGLARYFDWQRLREEVLLPLSQGHRATYFPFDWASGHGLSDTVLEFQPRDVVVVDGVYSARPELSDLYALTVLVHTPDDVRRQRQIERGHGNGAWFSRWEAAEKLYFSHLRPPGTFDLVVPGM